MLTSLIEETTAALGRRFALTALVPSALLVGLLGVVTAVSWWSWYDAFAAWRRLDTVAQGVLTAAVVLAGMLVATLAVRGSTELVRLYEGYWTSRPGRWLARVGGDHHRTRLAALAKNPDPRAYRRIHLGYPLPTQPEQVMPTTLGNILRNAELHPRDRYGIDAVLVWPRLYPLLPERMATAVATARTDLDSLLVISALSLSFAVAAGLDVLAAAGPAWLFATCFGAGAAVSRLAYGAATRAAVVYAQQIKVAFDVYRGDLLTHLGVPAPADPEAEHRAWQRLAMLWYRNLPEATEEPPPTPTAKPRQGASLGRVALALVALAWITGTVALALR
jgi:hypothetical protein